MSRTYYIYGKYITVITVNYSADLILSMHARIIIYVVAENDPLLPKTYDGTDVMGALRVSCALKVVRLPNILNLKNERKGQSLLSDFYHCFFEGDSSN